MKKIIIVSPAFHPYNSPRSIRTTELVKEFCLQGYDVTLLSSDEVKKTEVLSKKYGFKVKSWGGSVFKDIVISRRTGPYRILWAFRRILNLLFEYPDIELVWKLKNALKKESGYDLMISIAVPHPLHWGIALARKQKGQIAKIWVADCGDPYMGLKSDTFKKMFYFSYFEKLFCKRADFISIPTEAAIESYYKEFHDKIRVIPQGFKVQNTNVVRNASNKVPTFLYSGGLSPYLTFAGPFFKKLIRREEHFKLLVYTKEVNLLEDLFRVSDSRIHVSNFIEREDLLKVINQVDFLLHFPYKDPSQKSIKLIEYGFSGKPIYSYSNSDKDDDNLTAFLSGDYQKAFHVGDMEPYKIENVVKSFINLTE
jgi:hypothetical protein